MTGSPLKSARSSGIASDSRAPRYVHLHGHDSWELDALDPDYTKGIIEKKIQEFINDQDAWNKAEEAEEAGRDYFQELADQNQEGDE